MENENENKLFLITRKELDDLTVNPCVPIRVSTANAVLQRPYLVSPTPTADALARVTKLKQEIQEEKKLTDQDIERYVRICRTEMPYPMNYLGVTDRPLAALFGMLIEKHII